MSDKKTKYSPLNAKNNHGVTNDVILTYAHEKINIMLSVSSIIFMFYAFNLNKPGFTYTEFVKYQLGLHRNDSQNAM